MAAKISLTKCYQLSALHQLKSESYSEEMNLRTFGPCSRLHGHNYEIQVTVSGEVESNTGILISRDELDRIVMSRVVEPLRGTNLSHHFRHTTGEGLALEFYGLLSNQFSPPVFLSRLTVNETAKNSFTVGNRWSVDKVR